MVDKQMVDRAVDILNALDEEAQAQVFQRVPGFTSRVLQNGVVRFVRKIKLSRQTPAPSAERTRRRSVKRRSWLD